MDISSEDSEKINMENGDSWYFDEFGEYRSTDTEANDPEQLQNAGMNSYETNSKPELADIKASNDKIADEEFNETLKSPHINDQLNDPMLQRKVEPESVSEDDRTLGTKIDDK